MEKRGRERRISTSKMSLDSHYMIIIPLGDQPASHLCIFWAGQSNNSHINCLQNIFSVIFFLPHFRCVKCQKVFCRNFMQIIYFWNNWVLVLSPLCGLEKSYDEDKESSFLAAAYGKGSSGSRTRWDGKVTQNRKEVTESTLEPKPHLQPRDWWKYRASTLLSLKAAWSEATSSDSESTEMTPTHQKRRFLLLLWPTSIWRKAVESKRISRYIKELTLKNDIIQGKLEIC